MRNPERTKDDILVERVASLLPSAIGFRLPQYHPAHFALSADATASMEKGLYARMRTLAEPTITMLFGFWLTERDLLDDYLADSEQASLDPHRDAFLSELEADDCASIWRRSPELMEQLRKSCIQYDHVVREMLERLDADYEDICGLLDAGAHFQTVTEISMDCGDLHNGGRSTTPITTDAGTIVYKPHDIRIDGAACALFQRFFDDIMKAPRVLVRDGYGYTQFIVNRPAATRREAEQYFENLGGMAAVVQMLGSTDLHHNNVLAQGVYPVIIDYEVLITPSGRKSRDSFAYELGHSLLFSSLMPKRGGEVELSVLFARDEANRSAPVVDGRICIMQDFEEQFFRGFEQIYRRCMEQREELTAAIHALEGTSVRHIYRGTRLYYELRNRILQPGWLADPGLKDELVKKLSLALERSGVTGEAGASETAVRDAARIAETEADALLRGDIPYAYTIADSRDLYMDGKMVYRDFFGMSCMDHILSRIAYLSPEDMAFEMALLRKAGTRIIRRAPKTWEKGAPISQAVEIGNDALMAEAERIFEEIASDAVVTPGGRYCWFGPDYFLETGMQLLNGGLIEGNTGLGVFFSALHCLTGDAAIREETGELARMLLRRLEKSVSGYGEISVIPPNRESIAMSSGLAGKLIGCRLMGEYLGEDVSGLCAQIFSVIRKVDIRYEKPDIFGGLAGLLKALCRFEDVFRLEGVPAYCEELSDILRSAAGIPYKGHMIWRTLTPQWPISGAGHGQSGVASALYLAGKRLDRPDLLDAAMAGFAFEAEAYSDRLCAWPDRRGAEKSDNYLTGYCSGAPGIGLNALELRYPGSDQIIALAIDSALREPLQYKDFLCCGNSAVIEFLLTAGCTLGRPELVSEARTRMALMMERRESSGHYNCLNQGVSHVFSPGLFYGISGIGYEMLRLADPSRIKTVLL